MLLKVRLLTVGGVVSMLIPTVVTEAELPARSTAVPVTVWLAPWPLKVVGAEQEAMPDSASEHWNVTVTEYEEWGNPQDPKYFDYMASYSPYDNIEEKQYPNLLVTAGLNDPRVSYWEPAKWVAKQRRLKHQNRILLLKTNMGAGHGGAASGRHGRRHRGCGGLAGALRRRVGRGRRR